MANKPFQLHQTVFKQSHPPIHVNPIHEHDLNQDIVNAFLDTTGADGMIGVAPAYSKCVLALIAISTSSQVLLVRLPKASNKAKKRKNKLLTEGRRLLRDAFFCNPQHPIAAFRMDRLAVALYLDLALRVTGGVDLLSTGQAERGSLEAIMTTLGGVTNIQKEVVAGLFKHREDISAPERDIALQAWTACKAAGLPRTATSLAKISQIDTQALDETHLRVLAKTLRDADRLDALKPVQVKNDIRSDYTFKDGQLNLTSDRFKTRLHQSSSQIVRIETTAKGKPTVVTGSARKVVGRAATISLHSTFLGDKIKSVLTIGKENPTMAEGKRSTVILETLRRSTNLLQLPFVRSIWFPSERLDWPRPIRPSAPLHFPSRTLNPAQKLGVEAILSNHDNNRLCLIHGPPGTGKTTVIAASVTSLAQCRRPVWVIAHSNVAVKNVAEKLADVKFLDFKLLVSMDFHFDWHEHLYDDIHANVIRSDEFSDHAVGVERLLLESKVILCTLSMLSNPRLVTFMRLVPVETIIIDEASQIEIGDYIPVLCRFPRLQKLVFIGDDKQLAPYGQNDIDDLQSIFEIPHLRGRAIFLNVQYRMPRPIGSFISDHVYGGALETVHNITSKACCRLVDVETGREKPSGNSWANFQELRAVISIARQYNKQGKSYRIITPYDAQRNAIEKELQTAKLPWQDKCFNVDSFQGNEEDHIIISLVRSEKIGFLKEPRRTNVMLTRCKKSMIICTSRAFLNGVAAESLMGELVRALGPDAWLSRRKVMYATF